MYRDRVALFASAVLILSITGPARAGKSESSWLEDFARARQEAERRNRPILAHFYADWCSPCLRMEQEVLRTKAVREKLGTQVVGVKIDHDRHGELVDRFNIDILPSDVYIDPEGRILSRSAGYRGKKSYLRQLTRVLGRFGKPKMLPDIEQNARDKQADLRNSEAGKPARGVGLKGYSPVTLWKERQWRQGKERFAVTHRGIVYYMASAAEREAFRENPGRYAPRLLGCDAVLLRDRDRAVRGRTKFGAFFEGRLYLFANEENRRRFEKNPRRYGETRQALSLDDVERTGRR